MDLLQKAIKLGCIIKSEDYYLYDIQRWLREVHNVQLTIIPVGDVDFSLKYWHYSILGLNCNEGKNNVNRFFTYEQALEEGLKEALKLV